MVIIIRGICLDGRSMMGYLFVHVVDEREVCIAVEVVLVDMLSIFKYVLFMSFSISLLQTPSTFKENHFFEK